MATRRSTDKAARSTQLMSDPIVSAAATDESLDLSMATLVSKEGFTALAQAAAPSRPDDLTTRHYRALSTKARAEYNRLRHIYHANYGPVATPMLQTVNAVLEDVYDANRFKRGDKLSTPVVLSSPAGLGKTTAVVDFAQSIFRQRRAERGQYTGAGDEYIPVAYISLTSNPTPRGIDLLICNFYGEPTRGAEADLIMRAHDSVRYCRTELFIVDECQFIDGSDPKWGAKNINHLKNLVNIMPGTFVFVGTGLTRDEKTAALRPGFRRKQASARDHMLLQQMERRWTPVTLRGFNLRTKRDRMDWESVLLTIERDLVLCRKHPGMLTIELSEYLFERSSGHIGSLMSLISRGALRAIKSEQESLSEQLLNDVRIDAEAERQRRAYAAQFAAGDLSVITS